MKNTQCVPQKLSKFMIGSLLMLGAFALIISGFTILPIAGFFLAVPFAVLAIYFTRLHLNDKCEIDLL